MIGLGSLSAFEDVQALLKSKVGEFLQAEQTLRRLMTNAAISIRSQANAMLAEHQVIEADMGTAQAKIAQFQTGAWSISDAIALGDIGTRLLMHLSKVASLERQAGGVVATGLLSSSMAPILGVAAAAAVAILLLRK